MQYIRYQEQSCIGTVYESRSLRASLILLHRTLSTRAVALYPRFFSRTSGICSSSVASNSACWPRPDQSISSKGSGIRPFWRRYLFHAEVLLEEVSARVGLSSLVRTGGKRDLSCDDRYNKEHSKIAVLMEGEAKQSYKPHHHLRFSGAIGIIKSSVGTHEDRVTAKNGLWCHKHFHARSS